MAIVAVAAHLSQCPLGERFGLPALARHYRQDVDALEQVGGGVRLGLKNKIKKRVLEWSSPTAPRWPLPPLPPTPTPQVFEYIMQSLANYRSMHMRMQQLAAEGALDGAEVDPATHDRAAAGAPPPPPLASLLLRAHASTPADHPLLLALALFPCIPDLSFFSAPTPSQTCTPRQQATSWPRCQTWTASPPSCRPSCRQTSRTRASGEGLAGGGGGGGVQGEGEGGKAACRGRGRGWRRHAGAWTI